MVGFWFSGWRRWRPQSVGAIRCTSWKGAGVSQ